MHAINSTKEILFYVRVSCGLTKTKALVDTGAFNSALPLKEYQEIITRDRSVLVTSRKCEREYIRVANNTRARILQRATLRFSFMGKVFVEEFMVIDNLNHMILGLPFFANNDITINCATKRLHFEDMTAQLNEILKPNGKTAKTYKRNAYSVKTTGKIVIRPNEQTVITCRLDTGKNPLPEEGPLCGIVDPSTAFEQRTDLCVTSALVKVDDEGNLPVGLLNLSSSDVTLHTKTAVGKLKILSPQQLEFLTMIDPQVLAVVQKHAKNREELDKIITALYQLDVEGTERGSLNLIHPDATAPVEGREFWFATPETCDDPSNLSSIEKEIYETIKKFQKLEKQNPNDSAEDRESFLAQFNWENSILTPEERVKVEDKLVKYQHIFARHRLDIGFNNEFRIKLTPEDDRAVYSQGHPTPVHLRKEMLVELSLMQYYGIITTLPFSKHASPIFAQRKSNGNLRILIDLRRVNHLIRHDYDSHNFPISSIADVGHHLAGKKLFTKLDCSQAFHVVQMADLESIQLLAFNFEGRTYAYQRLAQGLSRSVTSFSSFMRKYLDPCIAAGRCFQYVDDVGSAAHDADELVDNLEVIFQCIEKSGLRLTIKKCEFGLAKINFLGNTITEQGITPNRQKVEDFLATMKLPKNPKQTKRLIGFLQFFRAFLPNLSLTLIPFYQLLKKNAEFATTALHRENFDILKRDLLKATDTYLRLPVADLQYVIVADASHYGAGYVLMIEDYCKESTGSQKILAPVSFGSKVFNPAQLKLSIHAKEFLAVYYAFDTFAHLLWGATKKKVLVLTDNKALAFFFQAKSIPTSLWNFLDRVMSFPFVIGHIPGNANAAADFLSRMHLDPTQKMEMRIKEPLPMQTIELDIMAQLPPTCNSIAPARNGTDLETITEIDEHEIYGEEYPEEARVQGNDDEVALENEAEPLVFMISRCYTYTTTQHINAMSDANPLDFFDLTHKTAPLEWIAEQKKDEVIQKVIGWRRLNYVPTLAFYTDEEEKYIKQFPRLMIDKGVLCREFYDDTGKVSAYQAVVPKHLRTELLYRLHNTKLKGHHGLMKTITEFRERFYFPGFTETLINHIKNCLTCVQSKPIPESHRTPPLGTMMTDAGLPADALQIDIVGQLPDSAGYRYILTAIDVFSRYLFAIPLRQQSAEATARALVGIFLSHSYLPTTIITDQGSNFTSAMMKELTDLLEIQLKHATVKHPQTVGTVERSHAALKKTLKIFQNMKATNWHTFVNYACYSHNTSYHSSIKCAPSLLFHGRDPNTPLDLRYGPSRNRKPVTQSQYVTEVKNNMAELNAQVKHNAVEAYLRYRSYYDRKANAEPLKLHAYCLLMNPKITSQNMFSGKNANKWISLFRVEKVLTNMNYIVRKVGTWFTQCVHRIRLRPFSPTYTVEDLPAINPSKFVPDPYLLKEFKEPQAFDEQIEKLIHDGKPAATTQEMMDHPFTYTPLISNRQRMSMPSPAKITNHASSGQMTSNQALTNSIPLPTLEQPRCLPLTRNVGTTT